MQNDQELKDLIRNKVERLAFFIEKSSMPDGVKVAWVKLLPELSLEQIDSLFDVVEAEYYTREVKEVDEKFESDLGEVMKEHNKKEENLVNKYKDKLEKLREEINE